MLRVKRVNAVAQDVSIEACKKEIRSWGYSVDDKHTWYLENDYLLEDDGRYNLYMNGKSFGDIIDENSPSADNEIVFCELIKQLNETVKDWVYIDINTGVVYNFKQYMNEEASRYVNFIKNMKVTAVNKSGVPLALSNFVVSSGNGYQKDGEYFKSKINYVGIMDPSRVCKELERDERVLNKSFSVKLSEWDRCEILTKDVLGNEAIIKVVY